MRQHDPKQMILTELEKGNDWEFVLNFPFYVANFLDRSWKKDGRKDSIKKQHRKES